MTQLYVGNLSEEGDEKSIRNLFGKYGNVREVLMKNGYAFVEMESPLQAEHVMRVLNGTDILGHPMIVEPSHQQRLSNRRSQLGIVEVTNIPTHMTLEDIENYFNQTIGPVVKLEIEDNQPSDFGAKRVLISFESLEMAQRAATYYSGDETILKCTVVGECYQPGAGGMKNGRRSIPNSPSKGNNEFPLRILVPSEMVGAIIGKDGATIRHITQLTKARVDVHRRENLGSMEKAITIIGGPESCTEACYQIMRIMQNELLTTNGSIFENGKHHFEPLPVVPLKVLAHNELVGRVIGKGGNTLKRIMGESGTKITISKLKDLTAYNMERTITILGTIDNCKKAESLISAKLRASYESDMSQFMLSIDHSPTSSPPHSHNPSMDSFTKSSVIHPQSLPTTPTAIRTFQDFNQDHTRLTTLHGSTGALEVNGLAGFYTQNKAMYSPGNQYPPSTIDPMPPTNGYTTKPFHYHDPGRPPLSAGYHDTGYHDDDLTDVFHGLSLKDPLGGIGSGGPFAPRTNHMVGNHIRRSSAPIQQSTMMVGWPGGSISEEEPSCLSPPSHGQSSKFISLWNSGANSSSTTTMTTIGSSSDTLHTQQTSTQNPVSSIWSPTFGSRPESELSSYHDSDSSNNGFSPIYSPVTGMGFDANNLLVVSSASTPQHTTSSDIQNRTSVNSPNSFDTIISLDATVTSKQPIGYSSYANCDDDDSFLDKLIKDPVTAVSANTVW